MNRVLPKGAALARALALSTAALLLGACSPAQPAQPVSPAGLTAYALTTAGQLATFGVNNAAASYRTLSVAGLQSGDSLVSLDYRNTDNRLYGVTASGKVYAINPTTGAATPEGASVGGGVSEADFNPVANRLRVIGSDNRNYRLTLNSAPVPASSPAGTVTDDGFFSYAASDANAGRAPRLAASAYSNSFNDSAAGSAASGDTMLYSLDAAQDTLVVHLGGPQFSTLQTLAPLGLDLQVGRAGFDIAGSGEAYALASSGNTSVLYRVQLAQSSQSALAAVTTLEGVSLKSLALGLPNR